MEIGTIGSNNFAATVNIGTQSNTEINTENKRDNGIKVSDNPINFSMSYLDNDIASIIDDIKSTMSTESINKSSDVGAKTISDYASEYGRILKTINTNNSLSSDDVDNLSKILNTAYDDYAKSISAKLADKVASFLNGAYIAQKSYEDNGTDIGIRGEQLVNRDAMAADVDNMMIAAKAFYNNNIDGTKEELGNALDRNFADTTSVENLSYKDFNSLQKAVDSSRYSYIPEDTIKGIKEAYNSALEGLKKDNATKTVTDLYKKAAEMNYSSYQRSFAYIGIAQSYDKQLSDSFSLIQYYKDKLKEFEKERKEKIEVESKKMIKMEEELRKASIKINGENQKGILKQLDDMKKQYQEFIQSLDETKKSYEDQLNEAKISNKKIVDGLESFKKNPSLVIDKYLQDNGNDSLWNR